MVQIRIDDKAALEAAIKEWFESEHGLIDVWIFNTKTKDWQKLLDVVSSEFQDLRYKIESEPAALPRLVDDVLKVHPEKATSLQITVDGIALRSYFFVGKRLTSISTREQCVGRFRYSTFLNSFGGSPTFYTKTSSSHRKVCESLSFLEYGRATTLSSTSRILGQKNSP